MKRSIGVTLVGILILVLSSLMLLIGVFMAVMMLSIQMPVSTVPNAPSPEQMRALAIVGVGFLGLMAGFGIVIGIGLLRLWSWARYTAIVVGFLMAGISALSALVMFVVPIPETPGTPPGFASGFRVGMAVFYLCWTALDAGISIFLLRASVGEQFRLRATGDGSVAELEPKPIAVLTVAGVTLMALLCFPYMLFMRLPTLLFGVEIPGVAGKLVMTVWILLFAIIGIGLIRRVREALWGALALYGIGIVSALLSFRNGALEHYYQQLPQYGAYDPHFSTSMIRMGMLMATVSAIVPIALLLIGKRKYFAWCDRKQLPVAPPQA